MKIIVTESQYNIILESQKYIELFQDIIDGKLDYIRDACERGAEDYVGDVGAESCRQIEDVERIEVTNAEWTTVKHSNSEKEEKYLNVRIVIYYSSIKQYRDFDDLTYELQSIIRKSTGLPIILNYDTTNKNTNFNW
jgi:hypothetical protein